MRVGRPFSVRGDTTWEIAKTSTVYTVANERYAVVENLS